MAAGWRRSKFKGSRPGNFTKLSTGKFDSFKIIFAQNIERQYLISKKQTI